MEGIPKEIRIPEQLIHRAKITHHAAYVEGTLRDISVKYGTQVVGDSSLGFPTPLSFEIGIGTVKGCIDYNDLPALPPCTGQYQFWYKFHKISAHTPFGNVRPFPPCCFSNWVQFRELRNDIRYGAAGNTILSPQRTDVNLRSAAWGEDLTRRRSAVREMLRENFGDDLDNQYTDQLTYWRKASDCLVSVHVPGIWNNMLDRAQLQMMAFGVCTISPHLYTELNETLVPGVHYLPCRDDYSDLPSIIDACRNKREKCRQVGADAKRFFDRNCTPEAVWSVIGREMSQASLAEI